jgi:hypothetical protein
VSTDLCNVRGPWRARGLFSSEGQTTRSERPGTSPASFFYPKVMMPRRTACGATVPKEEADRKAQSLSAMIRLILAERYAHKLPRGGTSDEAFQTSRPTTSAFQ